jgi:hypothetical protein
LQPSSWQPLTDHLLGCDLVGASVRSSRLDTCGDRLDAVSAAIPPSSRVLGVALHISNSTDRAI